MISKHSILAACLAATFTTGQAQAADTYTVDKTHAHVGFEIAHMVISNVKGAFNDYDASLTVSDGELESAAATLQVDSIDTKNEKRDAHLKNDDFFSAEKFPTMTFKSTGVSSKGGKDLLMGKLTIRDVTKAVTSEYSIKGPIKDPWGNTKVGFEASTKINRQDFGLTWSKSIESGGLMVGNDVTIEIDMEFAKAK